MPLLGKYFAGRPSDESATWGADVYRPSTTSSVALAEDNQGLLGSALSFEERKDHRGTRYCSSVECTGSRMMPWRNRRRPIFEGQWGCSGRCVLSMVRGAVRREENTGAASGAAEPHRHRVPLGLVMLAQGWITHPQLRQALEAQRERGGRIGERLISECGIEQEQITRGLSVQWNCPVLASAGFHPQSMALVMPRELVEEFEVLPLRVAGSHILYLASEGQLRPALALALEQMTDLKVESGLMNGEELRSAREKLLASAFVTTRSEEISDIDALTARITALVEHKQPVNSRLVRVGHQFWLRFWLENGSLSSSGTVPLSTEDMEDYLFRIGGAA